MDYERQTDRQTDGGWTKEVMRIVTDKQTDERKDGQKCYICGIYICNATRLLQYTTILSYCLPKQQYINIQLNVCITPYLSLSIEHSM